MIVWVRIRDGRVCNRPHRNSGILFLGEKKKKPKNLSSRSGCVTMIDWFRALDKYFDYKDIKEDKEVKHDVTRLKGHVALWWDELQADRHCKGKQ
jgi:hypothetical protein